MMARQRRRRRNATQRRDPATRPSAKRDRATRRDPTHTLDLLTWRGRGKCCGRKYFFISLAPQNRTSSVTPGVVGQNRPHAHLRRSSRGAVGGRGGGIFGIEGQGRGRRGARRDGNGIFSMHRVCCGTHEFAVKKTQGKNCAMQRHEQVLPPCRCIARICKGE